MIEGLFILKNSQGEETVVHGYHCTDMKGEFIYGFNMYDGGGYVTHADLTDDTQVIPVTVTEKL